MGSSLYAGVSGLNASARQMDVIGNNIANVNSIGFKADTIVFADILSKSIIGGTGSSMQVGRGVAVNSVSTQFSAGSLETTTNVTDLAIGGDGFFCVQDKDDNSYYTRAGAFHVDKNGLLVDPNGYTLQGLSGADLDIPGDLNVTNAMSVAEETSNVAFSMNLDAEALAGDTFNTSQIVYDSLGIDHTMEFEFTRAAAPNTWDYTVTLDNAITGTPSITQLVFDPTDGTLTTPAAGVGITFSTAALNGANIGVGGVVTWDVDNSTTGPVTGYAGTSIVKALTQDGRPAGELSGLSITTDGVITGSFTNGEIDTIGKVLLSSFKYPGVSTRPVQIFLLKPPNQGNLLAAIPADRALARYSPTLWKCQIPTPPPSSSI